MNKFKFYKILTFALLTILLGIFTQCISNAPVGGDVSRKPSSTKVVAPPKSEEQILNMTQVSTGIRNHEQLLHTYAELTNILTTNASIVSVYNDVSSSLPTSNDVKTFSPANQVAVTRLAAEFCSLLVDNATLNNQATVKLQIFTNSDISNLNLNSVDDQRKIAVIANMMEVFWGEGLLSPEEFDAAGDELLYLYNELAVGEPNNATSTKKVFKGVCTTILSSAYTTLI